VTTPRCVVLNKNILLVVDDDILVVMGDDDSNGVVILLGNRLRLDARLNLASDEVLDELGDGLLVDLGALIKRELLVLGGILDGKSGPLADFEVEVLCVLAKCLCIDGG
jgi:hypothetical protein